MNVIQYIKNYFRLKIYAPLRINKHVSYYSSHSQFGEDMVLRSIFGNKTDGIFVDLGAHHPLYYSNTYHFYKKGWKGLNIDGKPGSMKLFNQLRSRDINVESCIGIKDGEDVTFYEFEQSAFNTIDAQMAKEAISKGHIIIKQHQLKTKTLKTIIQEANLPSVQVDFFNIDIEGVDEIVLKNNDWELFKPKVIAFEDHNFNIDDIGSCNTLNFLKTKGYSFSAKCGPTIIVEQTAK
jgi:hypothetical protein